MFYDHISKFLIVIVRSNISILILFFMARLMGKKQISQLNYFDYIVGITIGSIASDLSIDTNLPIGNMITALIIWGMFPIVLSVVTLKNMKLRRKLEGTSTILIQNGVIIEKNLRKERYHINDLLEELRMKGNFNISDVDYAILETNGQISVLLKPEKQPITISDLNLKPIPQGLCANLIIDGEIMQSHLSIIGLDEVWLLNELKKRNFDNPKIILLATIDSKKEFHIYTKTDSSGYNVLD